MRTIKDCSKRYLRDIKNIFDYRLKSLFCSNVKLPNFLLVGFPKCGTTALHYYLDQHHDIFLPGNKELHFFSVYGLNEESLRKELFPYDELIQSHITRNIVEYRHNFCGAARYKAVGEMTPSYAIEYNRSIHNIYKYLENPRKIKIIIMLRDPVSACYSHYSMQHKRGLEIYDFDDSITLSKIRRKYNHYRRDHIRAYMYSESIKAFKDKFDDIFILLSDDLKSNTNKTLEKLCRYLEVDHNFKFDTGGQYNVGRYNIDISDGMRLKLYDIFKNDIDATEKLINRDLSAWKLK